MPRQPEPEPTPEEWAYIAGFFDGEGSIGLKHGHDHNQVVVRISQKDPEPLLHIKEVLGCGSVRSHERESGKHWTWKIGSIRDVRWFSTGVLPYCKLERKRERLQVASELQYVRRVKRRG